MGLKDEEKLEIFNKGVKEGKKHTTPSKLTINLITEMKQALKEFGKKLTKISDSLIDLNANANNWYKEQEELKKITSGQETRIVNIEKEKFGIYKMSLVVLILVPIIWSLLAYIYVGERMTEARVGEIVRTIINSEYKRDD